MSNLTERINADLVVTMKDRDPSREKERELKLMTLRTLNAEIKAVKVNQRKEPDDNDVIAILTRGIKQFKETLDKAGGANQAGIVRDDIVAQEKAKIAIFEAYLPQQLSDDELVALVAQAVSEAGASSSKDMGAVMAILRPKTAGKADGKKVSELVKAKLSG